MKMNVKEFVLIPRRVYENYVERDAKCTELLSSDVEKKKEKEADVEKTNVNTEESKNDVLMQTDVVPDNHEIPMLKEKNKEKSSIKDIKPIQKRAKKRKQKTSVSQLNTKTQINPVSNSAADWISYG